MASETIRTEVMPATCRRLAQLRVKWLIEHSTSYQLMWCIDSEEPIGVSDEPFARGEYTSYALSLAHSIISENKQEIVNKLSKIKLMRLSANHSKNERIAGRLIQDKHSTEEGLR